jgi:hypothetical protein
MIGPITVPRAGVLTLVLVIAYWQPASPKQQDPISSDFKIVAQFGPGLSDWKPWKCTITGDGKVIKEPGFHGNSKKRIKDTLSKKDIIDLAAKIKETEFFGMREEYVRPKLTDNPTLVLTITQNCKTHKVKIYAPDFQKENKEVKRFLRAWAEVLMKVPPPNPDQKPEQYDPEARRSGDRSATDPK